MAKFQVHSGAKAGARKAAGWLAGLGSSGGGVLDLVWVGAAAVLLLVFLGTSYVTIDPGQVAVRVNNLTGAQDVISQPGIAFRAPFRLQSIYVLDAVPQTFSMSGEGERDNLNVRELTVRASDGSNFRFDDTTLIFQIIGDRAREVVRDAGPGNGYIVWMRPLARAVLRDEFGRESTISVSNPANFGVATERARTRLNETLEPHGITVTKIVTPRPRFSEEYENLIEARNGAENQLTVIDSELKRAETERQRQLAEVDRDQNRIIQTRRAELETALATASANQAATKREADTYRISTVAAGQASRSAAVQRAIELKGELEAELVAKRAEIDAFRNQPVEKVMQRLGSRLQGVTIAIEPWSQDANPSRVQLEDVAGGAR